MAIRPVASRESCETTARDLGVPPKSTEPNDAPPLGSLVTMASGMLVEESGPRQHSHKRVLGENALATCFAHLMAQRTVVCKALNGGRDALSTAGLDEQAVDLGTDEFWIASRIRTDDWEAMGHRLEKHIRTALVMMANVSKEHCDVSLSHNTAWLCTRVDEPDGAGSRQVSRLSFNRLPIRAVPDEEKEELAASPPLQQTHRSEEAAVVFCGSEAANHDYDCLPACPARGLCFHQSMRVEPIPHEPALAVGHSPSAKPSLGVRDYLVGEEGARTKEPWRHWAAG
jgi:hypothetical protein